MEALAPARTSRRLAAVEVGERLTLLPDKRRLFAVDTYFREAYTDLCDDLALLRRAALVVLKPDALVGRRIVPCLELLRGHGFRPVAARTFAYDRLLIRETWRYQFNVASDDRIDVVDLLLTASPSLMVLLWDERPREACPASVRLGALKGPSDPQLRRPGQLRHELGVVTALFNFVHTSDEPADVVRDLGLLLDRADRRRLLAELHAQRDGSAELRGCIDALQAAHPAHDLDCERSLDRLRHAPDAGVRRAAEAVARDRARWRELLPLGDRIDRWDLLSIATAAIECNVPGVEPVVASVAGEQWARRWAHD